MPAKFVDLVSMEDEKDTFLDIRNMPASKTVRIHMWGDDGEASMDVPYALVPELAENLCDMLTRSGKVILANDKEYPDY